MLILRKLFSFFFIYIYKSIFYKSSTKNSRGSIFPLNMKKTCNKKIYFKTLHQEIFKVFSLLEILKKIKEFFLFSELQVLSRHSLNSYFV